jgi:hypothetical protein
LYSYASFVLDKGRIRENENEDDYEKENT